MRVTQALCKHSYRWVMKTVWRTRGFMREPPLRVSAMQQNLIAERGGSIEDPNKWPEFQRIDRISEGEIWEPPVKDDPRFMPAPDIKDHPDYHEEPIYAFHPWCRLLEGRRQALMLTKTQSFHGLPPSVQDLVGAMEIPDQDELMQRIIMNANVWNPTKVKLPKRFNPQIPGWHFKAERGIPNNNRTTIIIKNIVRLCQSLGGRYPELLHSRRVCRDPFLYTSYYKGDAHINIEGVCSHLISSDRPLPPIGDHNLLDESVAHKIEDLFPILPTIDIPQKHIYTGENITGWHQGFSHNHPHTLFIKHTDYWNSTQRNAVSLMMCFGYALAQAKHKYGYDVQNLPEPIVTQAIATNGETFHFTCFQLNTLNFSTDTGIKNFAWFDNDNLMYNKILPKRAMLRNTKYEDYDPEVFRKILALYMHGADLRTHR